MDTDTVMRCFGVFEDKTTKNQRDSPLLRLPAELRNKVYDLVCSKTQIRMRMPHPAVPSRNHRGALALLSTCRQLRHEASSTFHTMAVFEFSTFVLAQFRGSDLVLGSEPWNSIQSIQIRGPEVERWCYYTNVCDGNYLGKLIGDQMYIGYLPSLQHVLVVYSSDEAEDRWGFSYRAIADTLKLAFGKENLCIHIQADFKDSLFGWMACDRAGAEKFVRRPMKSS